MPGGNGNAVVGEIDASHSRAGAGEALAENAAAATHIENPGAIEFDPARDVVAAQGIDRMQCRERTVLIPPVCGERSKFLEFVGGRVCAGFSAHCDNMRWASERRKYTVSGSSTVVESAAECWCLEKTFGRSERPVATTAETRETAPFFDKFDGFGASSA